MIINLIFYCLAIALGLFLPKTWMPVRMTKYNLPFPLVWVVLGLVAFGVFLFEPPSFRAPSFENGGLLYNEFEALRGAVFFIIHLVIGGLIAIARSYKK